MVKQALDFSRVHGTFPRLLIKVWKCIYAPGMDVILDHMADDPNPIPIPDGTHRVLAKIDDAGRF